MDEILAKVKGVEERNATLAAELANSKRALEEARRAAASHAEAEALWKARELAMQRELGTKTSHLSAMENELKQNNEDQRRGASELEDTRNKLEQALRAIRKLEQDFQVAVMRLGAQVQVQGAPAAAEGGSMAP